MTLAECSEQEFLLHVIERGFLMSRDPEFTETLEQITSATFAGGTIDDAMMDCLTVTEIQRQVRCAAFLSANQDQPDRRMIIEEYFKTPMSDTPRGAYEVALKKNAAQWN